MWGKVLSVYGICLCLGMLTGCIGSAFQWAITKVSQCLTIIISQGSQLGISSWVTSGLLSMALVYGSWFLVKKFAPEASGSGVQEIEGALQHQRTIDWKRLLPVKFIAGVMALSAKMVVGREGPTIQIGGNLGKMLGDLFQIPRHRCDTLVASGAAAGLATAFNAPLAGILFVIEEMRNQFNFNFTNFKMVAMTSLMATVTTQWLLGSEPAIQMQVYMMPQLKSLGLFFLFGIGVGFAGLLFNQMLMNSLALKDRLSLRGERIYVLSIGAVVGVLAYSFPAIVGGGYDIISQSLSITPTTYVLILWTILRFFTTLLCYSTSVPGGIFAPMLALGTLLGLAGFYLLDAILPNSGIQPGMLAVAGMASFFAATVRAPVTGILLVVEMTQNYSLILPLLVSCLTSTTVMQLAKNQPIYSQLLRRTMKRKPDCV